jgi:hypothetical protein
VEPNNFRLFVGLRFAAPNPQFYQPTILDVGWVEQRGTQQLQALRWLRFAAPNPQFYQPTILDVGWVEQRGTQQLQALRWVTLRCTQPTILGVSIHYSGYIL